MVNLSDVFSTVGTIFSFGLSFTPIPPFVQVMSGKEKIDIIPEGMLAFTITTRIIWGVVWTVQKKLIPFINSALGVSISSVFFALYLYLYCGRSCAKSTLAILIFIGILAGIYLGGIFISQKFNLDLGMAAVVFNVMMYVSPGQKIMRVVREKNYKLIPIWSTIVSALCSLSWLLYGITISYLPQIIPNALGLFFSILNTLAWLIYYLKRNKDDEKDSKEEQLEMQAKDEA